MFAEEVPRAPRVGITRGNGEDGCSKQWTYMQKSPGRESTACLRKRKEATGWCTVKCREDGAE